MSNYLDNQIYHIVYLTTNLINQKFYVGVHSTYDLNDGYLGSGKLLQRAIEKYGLCNFKRQILHFTYSREQAYEIEGQIVNKNFIQRTDTYNIAIGGIGFKTYSKENFNTKVYGSPGSAHPLWKKGHTQKTKDLIKSHHKLYHNVSGKNNPKAKTWYFYSPNNTEYIITGTYIEFVKEHNLMICLNKPGFINKVYQGSISHKFKNNPINLNTIGWECRTSQRKDSIPLRHETN